MHRFLILIVSLSSLTAVLADCPREFLRNATNAYIQVQTDGLAKASTPAFSSHLAPNMVYTENFTPTSLNNSILTNPLPITHNFSMHDTIACSTFSELIILPTNTTKPYLIHTRMLFNTNTSKLTTIESIVTTTGDWAFNVTGYLHYTLLENWAPIPPANRSSRASIQAGGDAYFNRFFNSSVSVPWGAPCTRLEGGSLVQGTLEGDNCTMLWPDTIVVTDRRYVVDEEYGAVDIFDGFPGLDSSPGNAGKAMPDSHLFKVDEGKIRYVHTVSHCIERGCGLNGTSPFG